MNYSITTEVGTLYPICFNYFSRIKTSEKAGTLNEFIETEFINNDIIFLPPTKKQHQKLVKTKLSVEHQTFIYQQLKNLSLKLDEIENFIQKNIVNWSYSRLFLTDKSLLVIGVFLLEQGVHKPLTDFKTLTDYYRVVINVIIEYAKIFCEFKNSYQLINAVLQKVINR